MANHPKRPRHGAKRKTSPPRARQDDPADLFSRPVSLADRRRALELAAAAMAAECPEEHLRLLSEALALHPACIDANHWLILSGLEDPAQQAEALTLLAVMAADDVHKVPAEVGLTPYLRLLADLTMILEGVDSLDECAHWLTTALALDPDDGHWNRYRLLSIYLEAGRLAEAQELLAAWPGERLVTWAYGQVLVSWLAGDEEAARDVLAQAREANPGVEAYWVGGEQLPDELPTEFRLGGPEEAMWAGVHLGRAWAAHPQAAEWLRREEPAKRRAKRTKAATVPLAWRPRYAAIVEHTDRFCAAHLTPAFACTCAAMAARLCRDGSPVATGQPASWAAGIVAAVAWVNGLDSHDPDFGLTYEQFARAIGVAGSTAHAKVSVIKSRLRLRELDPAWTPDDLLIRNPKVWYVWVDGRPMDLRGAPREVQELAVAQGLIPFVPTPQAIGATSLGDFFMQMRAIGSLPLGRQLVLD